MGYNLYADGKWVPQYKGPREKGCVKKGWEESLKSRIIAEECGIWKWVKVKRRNGLCNRRTKCPSY